MHNECTNSYFHFTAPPRYAVADPLLYNAKSYFLMTFTKLEQRKLYSKKRTSFSGHANFILLPSGHRTELVFSPSPLPARREKLAWLLGSICEPQSWRTQVLRFYPDSFETSSRLKAMKFNLSSRSYAKILLHTSKYPHKAVNGVLLGGETVQDGEVYVLDAVPLFHICLGLAPMLEVALARVRQKAFLFSFFFFLLSQPFFSFVRKKPILK